MDDVGIATLSVDGDGQVVRLPAGFLMPGRELRVTRVRDGLLLQPVTLDVDEWWAKLDGRADAPAFDVDAWRAKLDEYRDVPFMQEGRQQPPMPDGDDISFD